MAVKIRLQRKGRKKRPFYHIVVADARAPRDGRFIEKLGVYNPMTSPATIDLDRDKAYDWLTKGAQPTDTVRAILRFKGVLYKKHLMRGVKKGALTVEQADVKYKEWIDDKESKITARIEQTASERKSRLEAISGVPAPPPPIPSVAEAVAADDAAEAAVAKAEAAKETAEVVTEKVEVVKEVVAKAEAKVETAEVTTEKVEAVKEVVAETKEATVETTTKAVADATETVEVVEEKVVVKGDDPEWDNA